MQTHPTPVLFWMAFKRACREGSGLTPVGVWIEGPQHLRPQTICFPKRGLKSLGLLRGFSSASASGSARSLRGSTGNRGTLSPPVTPSFAEPSRASVPLTPSPPAFPTIAIAITIPTTIATTITTIITTCKPVSSLLHVTPYLSAAFPPSPPPSSLGFADTTVIPASAPVVSEWRVSHGICNT